MKLLLLSLALFGIALIDGSGVEKREEFTTPPYPNTVGEEEDNSDPCVCKEIGKAVMCWKCGFKGCNKVSQRFCKNPGDRGRLNATALMIKNYNDMGGHYNYRCKCTKDGYCEQREHLGQNTYTEWKPVKFCTYNFSHQVLTQDFFDNQACDSHTCYNAYEGRCDCFETGFCVKHFINTYKLTRSCERETSIIPATSGCQYCDLHGCKEVPCLPQCIDDSEDAIVDEKCSYSQDRKRFEMCGEAYCRGVANCDRFATCTCDMRDDTYRRCYGYKNGHHSCRTLDKCSNVVTDIIKEARIRKNDVGTCNIKTETME